jgi:hypothetical protein
MVFGISHMAEAPFQALVCSHVLALDWPHQAAICRPHNCSQTRLGLEFMTCMAGTRKLAAEDQSTQGLSKVSPRQGCFRGSRHLTWKPELSHCVSQKGGLSLRGQMKPTCHLVLWAARDPPSTHPPKVQVQQGHVGLETQKPAGDKTICHKS